MRNSNPPTRRRAANCTSSRKSHTHIYWSLVCFYQYCSNVQVLMVLFVGVQGDAGQKGAGQTGPEGTGGDSGEFI